MTADRANCFRIPIQPEYDQSVAYGRFIAQILASARFFVPSAISSRARYSSLRGHAKHDDRTAVLRPARDVIANGDRPLFAVGYGAHASTLDAASGEIVTHGLGAACAKRDVVFTRAALVGVAFDGEIVAGVLIEPLRLLVERR